MEPTASSESSVQSFNYVPINNERIYKNRAAKESAFTFRRRRQPDWVDNQTLYRDKVQLNRLTQRQSVNIPLMKIIVKTLLKDVDDPPDLKFVNRDNNDQKEVYFNANFEQVAFENKLILKDIVGKRQVMLQGRTFNDLNIYNGKFVWENGAPEDHLVDRYTDPTNIDSARFLIREHIYKPISSLRTMNHLDNAAVGNLLKFMGTRAGLIKAEENQLDYIMKQKTMASLGLIDAFSPQLQETYLEFNDFFMFEYNSKTGQDEIHYMITAEDMEVLYDAPLDVAIGKTRDDFWKTHYPMTTWGDEVEKDDFWSDGVADSIRTLNRVLNAFFSQMIENRTYKNFNMNFFNSNLGVEGFSPQTFEATPWGFYGFPVPEGGKISDVIMPVPVPDLTDTTKDMEFIMQLAQQASAATTFQQGVQQPGAPVTLGEVQLLLKNAQERVKSMAVYYTDSWRDFGLKYCKFMEAAPDLLAPVTLHRKGKLTDKIYSKNISPNDWYSVNGWNVEVKMKEEVDQQTMDSLQKLNYSKSLMPDNMALSVVIKKKSLDFANVPIAEQEQIMKEDEEKTKMMQQAMAAAATQGGIGGVGQPGAGVPVSGSPATAPSVQPAPMPPQA